MAGNCSEPLLFDPTTECTLAESPKAQGWFSLYKNSLCDSEQVLYLPGPLHLKNVKVALDYL